jgi:hypothetical protein
MHLLENPTVAVQDAGVPFGRRLAYDVGESISKHPWKWGLGAAATAAVTGALISRAVRKRREAQAAAAAAPGPEQGW